LPIECSACSREGVQHALRWVDRDDLADREGQRQGVTAGAGPDVEPHVAGPGQLEKSVEDRFVAPVGVGEEEPGHGGVEVGAVRHLPDPIDLLAILADAIPPLEGGEVRRGVDVRVGAIDLDPLDEIVVLGEDRAQASVADGFVDQLEGFRAQEHRVGAASLGIARHDDRPVARARRGDQAPDDVRPRPRLIAQDDDHGVRRGVEVLGGGEADAQR
jgi:hypothetical protein